MTEKTLEALQADLETARYDFAVALNTDPAQQVEALPDRGTMDMPLDEAVSTVRQVLGKRLAYLLREKALNAAKDFAFKADVVDIARDYGVDAAVLYKLSDGNIDPRKP